MSVNKKVTVPTGSWAGLTARAGGAMSVMVLLLRDRAKPPGQLPDDRKRQRRVVQQHPLEVPGGDGEAACRELRHDLGDPGHPVEHGQLTEELARPERRQQRPIANDPDFALDDDEEPRPDLALPGDDATRRELDLGGGFGDGR